MSNKVGTALVKRACRVCAKTFDAEIVLNTKLTEYNAKKVEDLHQKVVGYLEEPCDNCKELMGQGIVFIGVDDEKTEDKKDPYRTGHMAVVRRSAIKDEKILEHGVAFVDYNQGVKLGIFPEPKEEV